MSDSNDCTGWGRRSPWAARWTLAAALAATVGFVAIAISPLASGFADKPSRGSSDVDLYRAEVQRMRQGEGYYESAAVELRQRGYPTRSVFNWRLPLLIWSIARAPDPAVGKIVLGLLALAVMLLAFEAVARDGNVRQAVLAALLLTGPLMPCVLGDLYLLSELWAGVLIALSLCCYGVNRPAWGVALGLAALGVRELAALYGLIALALAMRDRRWRETAVWLAGFAAYAVYFAVHAQHVAAMQSPTDIAHAHSWLRFGGAAFVISLAQVNAYLLLLPQWLSAIYLALALLGAAGWQSSWGQRVGLSLCGFLAAFAVVGHDFNQYWGAVIAPLLALSVAQSPLALHRLWTSAGFSIPIRLSGLVGK